VSLRQRCPQEKTLQDFTELIDATLRTAQSKQAHSQAKRLTIVHPERRDGGLMTCFLSASGDEILVGDRAVRDNCLRVLRGISGSVPPSSAPDPQDFGALPPLALVQVRELQRLCSSGKGVAFDAFSDTWIRNTQRRELLCDWW
jgi:hypothetical protein